MNTMNATIHDTPSESVSKHDVEPTPDKSRERTCVAIVLSPQVNKMQPPFTMNEIQQHSTLFIDSQKKTDISNFPLHTEICLTSSATTHSEKATISLANCHTSQDTAILVDEFLPSSLRDTFVDPRIIPTTPLLSPKAAVDGHSFNTKNDCNHPETTDNTPPRSQLPAQTKSEPHLQMSIQTETILQPQLQMPPEPKQESALPADQQKVSLQLDSQIRSQSVQDMQPQLEQLQISSKSETQLATQSEAHSQIPLESQRELQPQSPSEPKLQPQLQSQLQQEQQALPQVGSQAHSKQQESTQQQVPNEFEGLWRNVLSDSSPEQRLSVITSRVDRQLSARSLPTNFSTENLNNDHEEQPQRASPVSTCHAQFVKMDEEATVTIPNSNNPASQCLNSFSLEIKNEPLPTSFDGFFNMNELTCEEIFWYTLCGMYLSKEPLYSQRDLSFSVQPQTLTTFNSDEKSKCGIKRKRESLLHPKANAQKIDVMKIPRTAAKESNFIVQ